jgi:hypothetical protein
MIEIVPKARLPIVAALHHMQRDFRDDNPWLSGHIPTTARIYPR